MEGREERKKGKGFDRWLLLLGMMIGIFAGAGLGQASAPMGEVRAAGSYTNAREFFETVNNRKHTEIYNGDIYHATVGKQAAPGSNLRYYVVGQDLTVSGNGLSLGVSVKRDGRMQEISCVNAGGYVYVLYRISCRDLIELMYARNPSLADRILEAELVEVTIDSILTTKSGSSINGGISENEQGTVNQWGTIYHIKEDQDLKRVRRIFSGHDFSSYIDIRKTIDNFVMRIRYDTGGGIPAEGYGTVKDTAGADILCRGGQPVETALRLLQRGALMSPDNISLSSSPKLYRRGYHLIREKQWVYHNRYFGTHTTYLPKEIHPEAGLRNVNLTMQAAWQPNTYTIRYHPNGGQGLMGDQLCVYDTDTALQALAYTREGYVFREWNTRADGSGTAYGREYENVHTRPIRNLTERDQEVVTLYALWEPEIYRVQTVKDGGTGIYRKEIQGGADCFYEKYEHAWCSDGQGEKEIGQIAVPSLYGYKFLGYYTGVSGTGAMVVDAEGAFAGNPLGTPLEVQVAHKTVFRRDSLVYAHWRAKQCRITFQKEGGYGGSEELTAVYGEAMPYGDGPVREGWDFQGYYTRPGGKGTCYYNENMAGMQLWDREEDTVLYAFWKDTTAPAVTLTASAGQWTNRRVTLKAEAWDFGVGLDRIEIYRGDVKVAEQTGLTGQTQRAFYENPKEGAIRYKAVAYDRNGLRAEAWRTVYYDATAPKVRERRWLFDGYVVSDSLFVTDYVSVRE